MADAQLGSINTNFAFRNATQGNDTSLLATPANYASIDAIKTRLAAIDGAYFTTDRMNSMTVNDLTYALRLADDPGTI